MRTRILTGCAILLGILHSTGVATERALISPSQATVDSTLEVLQGGSLYPSRSSLCGPLCLYLGARYMGIEQYSVDDIAAMADWDPGAGTTLLGLEDACKRMGFAAQSLEFRNVGQLDRIMRQNNALAIIEGSSHYCLFTKIGKSRALGITTTLKPTWIPLKTFVEDWDRKALLFSRQPIHTGGMRIHMLYGAGVLALVAILATGYLLLAGRRRTRTPGADNNS
jgi:hypothetical protein